MSEEEKYIKCKNCHQNILESKIFLHKGFCLRNNKLCPECNKVFLFQEYDEHLKTHNAKNISNQKKSPISEHRKNCHHDEPKNLIPIKNRKKFPIKEFAFIIFQHFYMNKKIKFL